MKKKGAVTDTLFCMSALSMAGGFLDAYSYTVRDGVLATAQTGNIVFLCAALALGDFIKAFSYLVPIFAFTLGMIAAHSAKTIFEKRMVRRWRTAVLLFEIAVLIIVAFTTESRVANALISFMCGIQLSAFRTFDSNAAATTMCTGNLRSAVDALYEWKKTSEKAHLHLAGAYLIIIASFIIGAVFAAVLAPMTSQYGVLAACVPILYVGVHHFIVD